MDSASLDEPEARKHRRDEEGQRPAKRARADFSSAPVADAVDSANAASDNAAGVSAGAVVEINCVGRGPVAEESAAAALSRDFAGPHTRPAVTTVPSPTASPRPVSGAAPRASSKPRVLFRNVKAVRSF